VTRYDRLADLPLAIDGYGLSLRERDTSSGFTRTTTVVELRGDGVVGRGEDVTYETAEHHALAGHDAELPLTGRYAFGEFSTHLDGVDLFPAGPPDREVFRNYRRWGIESAALDLALRQSDATLGGALGRQYDPVRFVVSTRLGDPPTFDRVERLLERDPELEFKLDPTPGWTAALVDRLADTGAVVTLDFKGRYDGVDVGQGADPELYRRLAERFPDALLEDPALTDAPLAALEPHRDRVAWDAPIHGVADVEGLPWEPAWLNVKPSRFGSVRSLFDTIEYCEERAISMYGGGQFELDVGREHVQSLASLFYPDSPNDVAPAGYNDPAPAAGLPSSPLEPPAGPRGL